MQKIIVDEDRRYSEEWVDKYVFIIQNTNFMYLICRETVDLFKEYSVKRYYETKHNDYFKFDKKVKQSKFKEFMLQLKTQQKNF